MNSVVKLIVGAGKAAPSPPVGPALGSKGIKAIDFCKEFNARTANYVVDVPIPCLINIKPDRTFFFEIKSPPTGYLLLKALGENGAKKGSAQANKFNVIPPIGEVSLKHVYEIAKIKKTDERHKELEMKSIVKTIIGVAKTMGIQVVP